MKNKVYKERQEIVLGDVPSIDIPEIKIRYYRSKRKKFFGKVSTSKDVADFIRRTFQRGDVLVQEQFILLLLNQANDIIGYYMHSKGGIAGTVADVRLLLSVALKASAVSIILSHNHPSGNLKPSDADLKLTNKVKDAAKLMDITVLDHIIVTQDGYTSFADDGLFGINELLQENLKEFRTIIEKDLRIGYKHNKRSIEALAYSLRITDQTEIKELTELAIVNVGRELANGPGTTKEKFDRIVELYNNQMILSHRTSESVLLQQYSTPAPIGYIMGVFCGLPQLDNIGGYAFEPSAGNGLLTIAAKPEKVYVNEISYIRNRNLRTQGFANVFDRDATNPMSYIDLQQTFPAVLTNPPFGILDKSVRFGTFPIRVLDHLLALRALETMIPNGRAAIIIGGHTKWDKLGRVQKGKNRILFNYLYHHYNVADVIQIDGQKLYTRQGTGFPTRLILIDGKKRAPVGAAPLRNIQQAKIVRTFDELFDRVQMTMELAKPFHYAHAPTKQHSDITALELEANKLRNLFFDEELGMVYVPASQAVVLNTQVPDSMGYETHAALERIKREVGGNMDNFVRHRLGYRTSKDLYKALSAEQIDAVAMAIYNIEAKGQGMIIGDQTGIGKGRIAAAMIRYAVVQGYKPPFITEKANLFSDIYRDLSAIGSAHFKPFIINGRESKTDIKDEDGNVIYTALAPSEQSTIFHSNEVPATYDFEVGTYSQFNSPEKKPEKPNYLRNISKDNILIMDESHNSSGSSNTGEFMQRVVRDTKGVVFLSATFAKRPDNMPIYAMKTCISEANLTKDELVEAITKGGVALQEVISSQLVAEGQMIRRERSFEGVEVNYLALDTYEETHRHIADGITGILRDIIAFQGTYIDKLVQELDEIAAAEGKETDLREGTSQAGVDNLPYFSKVFNVINQMLFSIKAEAVADRTIERLKEGKKPVIAFASTMGSFIEQMENEQGLSVGDGDLINTDFSEVLRRGLDGVLRYTEKDIDGQSIHKKFELAELPQDGQLEYERILERIAKVSTGISISPIDVIIKKLERAGYSVVEVTGRKFSLQLNDRGNKGLITSRKKINTNDAFRQFNNNEVDVLMINQSGSTGASAHAIVTPKVSTREVKQRVMIVLQAELDINTEVQKRGRINRTGQILKPIYDYMISAIPAEKRLMMMLQKKLKSLDANTTSNQKQSTKILDVPDFLNKYGDKVVQEYLLENPEIDKLLGKPLQTMKSKDDETKSGHLDDAAHKVSGRVAVLSTKMQADFYSDITERYNDYVEYLKQIGGYDLEVEALNLEAETLESTITKMGKGGESAFGEDSILERVEANILKKPFSRYELKSLVSETLAGQIPEEHTKDLLDDYTSTMRDRRTEELRILDEKYSELINDIPEEKKVKKVHSKEGEAAYLKLITERKEELLIAKSLAIEQLSKSFKNKGEYIQRILNFFSIGRKLAFPVVGFANGQETVLAVSLGVIIDKKKKNPYAPNAIRVRVAIANSSKYLAIPASYNEDVSKIIAASFNIVQNNRLFEEWQAEISQKNRDRGIRYIITGNLLQAFGSESGKLVSYTTKNGQTKKGILLPEEWQPKAVSEQKISVPIVKGVALLKSMRDGSALYASNNLAFFRSGGDYRIILPMARSKAGDIYIDRDLMALVNKGVFEKMADKMQAILPAANLDAFAVILQEKYGVSLSIGHNQMGLLKNAPQPAPARKVIALPPPEEKVNEEEEEEERIRILELEAEALILELEMAA